MELLGRDELWGGDAPPGADPVPTGLGNEDMPYADRRASC